MIDIGLIVVVVLAAIAARFILKRSATAAAPAASKPPPAVALPMDLQAQVRSAAARGNAAEATKLVRRETGVSGADATAVVHALLSGHVFPVVTATTTPTASPRPPSADRTERAPIDGELMVMLKDLIAQDPEHRTAAIMLLRQRTGMNDRDARKFINAI